MKYLILAAALVAATPAAAETDSTNKRGMLVAQPVRYEFVYEAAKHACAVSHRADDPAAALNNIADKLTLSNDEAILLFDYCLIWIDGRQSTR